MERESGTCAWPSLQHKVLQLDAQHDGWRDVQSPLIMQDWRGQDLWLEEKGSGPGPVSLVISSPV